VNANKIRINTSALGARLPTMPAYREYVEAGGLMSYGANLPDLFRRSADYVDKILRGGQPGNIPVEQPTKFDLGAMVLDGSARVQRAYVNRPSTFPAHRCEPS
jgi:putative ABC transport system substrate-binding protein